MPSVAVGLFLMGGALQEQEQDQGEDRDSSLRELPLATQDTCTALEHNIDTMAVDSTLICSDMGKISKRVIAAEVTLTDHTEVIQTLQDQVGQLKEKTAYCYACAGDAEGRCRCNIIHLVGVPKWTEETETEHFVEGLVCLMVKPEYLSA
ncbi:hypothetical protein NDU88_004550 [Pleurodeles waltl]|uniref:Uncharacterized protein n=1 Tax=Pleurodeles waltl TaxID=8319 RepID=A0AAV7UFK0_PLEWA|nr:hypothetical protein NDU88_004550 [Pleurodeles waltl]